MSDEVSTYFKDRDIYVVTAFNEEMEQEIIPYLISLANKAQRDANPAPVTFWINSYGGYTDVMWSLVEAIELLKRNRVTVRTVVTATAYSCGSMLAISGSAGERYISHNAEHLLHLGSANTRVTTELQLERESAWLKRHFERIVSHYEKYAKVPDLREHLRDDGFFVPARNAIKYGLADKFTDKLA